MSIALPASIVFVVGYAVIAFEHRLELNKSLTASALGAILWLAVIVSHHGAETQHSLDALGTEIFEITTFLILAMMLVELLNHYRFFDMVRARIIALRLHDYGQFWVIGGISFVLSGIIDNLTTTIVMLEFARRFFRGANLLRAAAMIVIAANTGGAFSPIGDITTFMLWRAEKFTATEIIMWGFLPSVALFLVSTWLLAAGLQGDTRDSAGERVTLSRSEKAVVVTALSSFALPVFVNHMGSKPYLGLLAGVGLTGGLAWFFRLRSRRATHLEMDIEKMIKKVDFASIVFFIGILLAVGSLKHLGILAAVSTFLFGEAPALWRLVAGNMALGILSALVDNIPLTAAAIDILRTDDPLLWVLLALTVGTGGSLIVFGSAAGVMAMNKVKELTFFRYAQIAMFPAAVGYFVAIGVWYLQYLLFV